LCAFDDAFLPLVDVVSAWRKEKSCEACTLG
jgi:hypothetical protein